MIALTFGYKIFDGKAIDELTIEQYNILVELLNHLSEEKKTNKHTVSFVSVGSDKFGED